VDPGKESDEVDLIDKARAGDQAAFRRLVEKYQRRVYSMALGMVKDTDEARDIVQETFLKAYQHLSTFHGQAGFFTWLYRITMNLCIDRARRKARVGKVEFDETADAEEAGDSGISPRRLGFDPAHALRDREIREHLNEAMARLSPTHRAVLLLREVDGLAYRDIAEVMQCSEGTVMSRLFHARKRMQEMLRPIVEDEPARPAPPASLDPAAPAKGPTAQAGDDEAASPAARKVRS
jgi:RNA polymerase sigma-70 factor (ECF subfamily)